MIRARFLTRTQTCAVGLTLLLLLSGAGLLLSRAVAAPASMLFARTAVTLERQRPLAWVEPWAIAANFSVTTDADTTAAIALNGLRPWQIINESGASATLTFYDALTTDGTEFTPYDQDGVAVGTMTIGDDCSQEMPSALAGCTILVIKGASAGDGFTLVCKQ